MSMSPTLSVVLALSGDDANLPAILTRLRPDIDADVELIVCTAGTPSERVQTLLEGSAQIIVGAPDTLVPLLWRDGIRAARGRNVATTTADFIHPPDWIARLRAIDTVATPGIGGVIENDPHGRALDQAIYLLRYSAYAPPQAPRVVREIAADNAVYNRAALLRHSDLLAAGFWEPTFHSRFRAEGLEVRIDPALTATYRGHENALGFIRHRFRHGRRYGADRAGGVSPGAALLLLFASPLVPAITLGRIVARVLPKRRYWGSLARGSGWLAVVVLAWSFGESVGYLDRVRGVQRRLPAGSDSTMLEAWPRSSDADKLEANNG